MKPTIALLGLGAVGSLMAFHWRTLTPYAVLRNGASAQRTLIDLDNTAHPLTLPAWQGQPVDWLVICTKAADTLTALHALPHPLARIKRILLIQNGMGQQQEVADWLAQRLNAPALWVGSSTEGAYRQDHDTVVYAGKGQTVVAPWLVDDHQATHSLPLLPPLQLPHTVVVDDIHQRLITKLAVNAVINPLTAYYRCRNGELLTETKRFQDFKQLADEIATLYRALAWPLPESWQAYVHNIAIATAHNRSSTLQDVLAGRTHELAYINGYLQFYAQQSQVAMPLHDALIDTLHVKALDLPCINH